MRLLAFSDLHLARARAADLAEASAEADLVIGAGDFCNMRQGLDLAMEMLGGISAPIIAVPGNAESAEELRAAALPNMTVLHGETCAFGGLTIAGLGGGVPVTPFGSWSFDLTEEKAAALLDKVGAADILVTHSPPQGLGDKTSGGLSVGSAAVRAAIVRLQPKLALCGHIHDSWGARGHIGGTEVANLGPMINWFEVET